MRSCHQVLMNTGKQKCGDDDYDDDDDDYDDDD